ncbi:phosphate regulon transcriptional regulator PhoB [Sphaerotilus sp.]|uniref:phosphate regulon transcriptional regulator PhoB n=1 Tax=Sphaerotilus sp. TaxID=2093942 RepID=UPI002ACDF1DD|nr:phosphate regulon transcriptional regulator PhoB [Sphaerotilus sp.]MDZ7855519.1 phosphate regulon transcriptional regulator PhoB [Sphaerotilus sp.]
MARVLVVEDEPAIAELIAIHLRHAGFEVALAAAADQAQAAITAALPDLVLLDWMLPGGASGLDLVRRWRADIRSRELPVILLTARAQEQDKIAGLDAGADDYLVKPFSPGELLARMRAVLRRRAPLASDAVVEVAGLALDPTTRRVRRGDTECRLGPTEFKLLHYLLTYPEHVHSRAQLLDRVWGDHVFIEERTVDVHIKRLREALLPLHCAQLIETVRGVGYRFTLSAPPV